MVKKHLASLLIGLTLAHINGHADKTTPPELVPPTTFYPGEPLDPQQVPAGYHYPAKVVLRDAWDIYATGDFLYWNAFTPAGQIAETNSLDGTQTKRLYQKHTYRPGFKVALGAELEGVVVEAEYLWFHHDYTSHFTAGTGKTISPSIPIEGFLGFVGAGSPHFAAMKSKWELDLDQLILSVQSPFHLGRRLVLNAIYGVLGQWHGQKWNIKGFTVAEEPATGFSKTAHRIWVIGPYVGLRATSFFGGGFSAIGDLNLSLDYLRFTQGKMTMHYPTVPSVTANNILKYANQVPGYVVQGDAQLGLGWHRYFAQDRYHVDFSLTYSFWGMWRFGPSLFENVLFGSTFLHGITVSGRFDF